MGKFSISYIICNDIEQYSQDLKSFFIGLELTKVYGSFGHRIN